MVMTPPKNATAQQKVFSSLNMNGVRRVQDDRLRLSRMCPECVAYDLMRDIIFDDPKKPLPQSREFRAYILDLYAECLDAVQGRRVGYLVAKPPAAQEPASAAPAKEPSIASAAPPLSAPDAQEGVPFERQRKRRVPA
jgi:hypothetical protein